MTVKTDSEIAREVFPQPVAFHVYCVALPTKRNELKKPYPHRVRACATIDDAHKAIAEDRKAMGETFGGLIESGDTSRRIYRVFRATWTEITL